MGLLKSSFDSQMTEFNFADSGGAIGVYNTGLFIEEFSLVTRAAFQPIVPFASGGAATIAVGLRTSDGILVSGALLAATAFGGPFPVNNTGVYNSLAFQVVFEIAGAPITAGQMLIYLNYFNGDK